MYNWIFIAIGAGLTAAALHATVVTGSPAAVVLFILAPLPLFLAGLGWGPVVAAAGGLTGAIALAVAIGLKQGVAFIIPTAIAPVLLSHLALISRPVQAVGAAEGEAADSDVEWYPEGRLILWCAAITCALMIAAIFVIGGGADGFHAAVNSRLDEGIAIISDRISEAELARLRQWSQVFSKIAAPLAASILLLSTLFNMWVASRVLTVSARSPRPWAPFGSYALPRTASLALSGAALAAFLPGTLGLIGWTALSLMITTFTIIGLATLHGLTMGNPMRVFILSSVYLALFVLSWVIMLPLVILALADMMLKLRQRRAAAAGGQED